MILRPMFKFACPQGSLAGGLEATNSCGRDRLIGWHSHDQILSRECSQVIGQLDENANDVNPHRIVGGVRNP